MGKALIVVDVQNDFCEGGSLPVQGGTELSRKILKFLLARTGGAYEVVVATRDCHAPDSDNGGHFSDTPDYVDTWPAHCVKNSRGADFKGPLHAGLFDDVFYKGQDAPAYSGFQGTGSFSKLGLESFLRDYDVDSVDVVGIAYDYCVKATAIDSAVLGFTTTVLNDLCVGVSPETSELATEALLTAGVGICELVPA